MISVVLTCATHLLQLINTCINHVDVCLESECVFGEWMCVWRVDVCLESECFQVLFLIKFFLYVSLFCMRIYSVRVDVFILCVCDYYFCMKHYQ